MDGLLNKEFNMEHELKTWNSVFGAITEGLKTAEFRKNDRNFKVDDILLLREYLPDKKEYTGREIRTRVTHCVYGGMFGIPKGYCLMSIKLLNWECSVCG